MDNVFFNTQRVYHYIVASMELNEIKAAEGCRILILVSAIDL